MIFSDQVQQLYKTLIQKNRPLSAKELSKLLGIVPNSVYRLLKPLIEMGLVTQSNKRPFSFRAKSIDDGLSLFLLHQNNWYIKQFFSENKPSQNKTNYGDKTEQVKLSFVRGRDELMNLSHEEIEKSSSSVDLLRSGHEIPPDVMLALKNAIKKGVIVRMLVQNFDDTNVSQILLWKKNGILVRKTDLRHIRLMLYDSKILYFMSYKNNNSKKDLGMKMSYSPLATIFSKLFCQWWEEAEECEFAFTNT